VAPPAAPKRLLRLRNLISDVLFAGPIGWLGRRKVARRLLTSGYDSGLVAFGEQNTYRIPPRWVTVDLWGADFNRDIRDGDPLPFSDASQRVVYSAHTIEHLDDRSLKALLGEARRVLRPGGTIRLETPDVERLVDAYLDERDPLFDHLVAENRAGLVDGAGYSAEHGERHNVLLGLFSCYIEHGRHVGVLASREEVNRRLADGDLDAFGAWAHSLQTPEQRVSGGHVNALYFAKLRRLLEEAGFTGVRRLSNGVTEISGVSLRWIERPGARGAYSVYVESTVPG
jgi:predicted SAM-dependent methyltransferase